MNTKIEVAKLFRVGKDKVQNWIDSGELEAVDIANPGSGRRQFRISDAAIERFKQRRSTLSEPQTLPAVTEFV